MYPFLDNFCIMPEVNPSTPRHKCWGLPSARAQAEGSGLTLHFDRLSVLSLSKEAALLYPAFKAGFGAAEWVNLRWKMKATTIPKRKSFITIGEYSSGKEGGDS